MHPKTSPRHTVSSPCTLKLLPTHTVSSPCTLKLLPDTLYLPVHPKTPPDPPAQLLARTGVLGEENSDLRRQLALSKQTEQELAKRNNVYQKTIKSLLTKLKEQGMQHKESGVETAELETKIADMESAVHLSQLQVDDMEHQLAEVWRA
eukprot:365042-Chlamydomonas_euryale.AAC.29